MLYEQFIWLSSYLYLATMLKKWLLSKSASASFSKNDFFFLKTSLFLFNIFFVMIWSSVLCHRLSMQQHIFEFFKAWIQWTCRRFWIGGSSECNSFGVFLGFFLSPALSFMTWKVTNSSSPFLKSLTAQLCSAFPHLEFLFFSVFVHNSMDLNRIWLDKN